LHVRIGTTDIILRSAEAHRIEIVRDAIASHA
jgi:Fe2+ transport system protein FeoA